MKTSIEIRTMETPQLIICELSWQEEEIGGMLRFLFYFVSFMFSCTFIERFDSR